MGLGFIGGMRGLACPARRNRIPRPVRTEADIAGGRFSESVDQISHLPPKPEESVMHALTQCVHDRLIPTSESAFRIFALARSFER